MQAFSATGVKKAETPFRVKHDGSGQSPKNEPQGVRLGPMTSLEVVPMLDLESHEADLEFMNQLCALAHENNTKLTIPLSG